MIDDELLPKMADPIIIRLKKGMGLFISDVQDIGEIIFEKIEGSFAGIAPTLFKGYKYYALNIKDETNLYQVLFLPQASNLRYLLQCMDGEIFIKVCLQAYVNENGYNRIRIWLDDERTYPHTLELPKIKRVRDGKGKPYHCLYGALLNKVATIIKAINKKNHIQHTLRQQPQD